MTNSLFDLVTAEKARQDRANRARKAEYLKENTHDQQIRDSLFACLRPATVEEYVRWLKIRLKKYGVKNLIFYRNKSSFYIATKAFPRVELYGASAVYIIVPRKIAFIRGDIGHSVLYLSDGEMFPDKIPVQVGDDDLAKLK